MMGSPKERREEVENKIRNHGDGVAGSVCSDRGFKFVHSHVCVYKVRNHGDGVEYALWFIIRGVEQTQK